ncbi:TesB-like acyl-CoA thioesterase 2 (plasmid) [Bacillus thuringiensis serovar thuringiensis str. IS5056]|nr:TesB-like acyl-CoA thioesterase 2 [Bacillus thuringiensis serovar thuringiensis str. IS5056]
MDNNKQNHPFDTATQLTGESGIYYGYTSECYTNMVGPFGGIIAATLLRAVMEHPERKGEPVSLTINYTAPVLDGNFSIKAIPTRTNRSTQHWYIELCQDKGIIITGTAVFASRRETWSSTERAFPNVPSANEVKSFSSEGMPPWVYNYDMRIIQGTLLALSQPNQKILPILSHSNGSRMNREDPSISYHLQPCAMRFFPVFTCGVNKWFLLALFHLLFIFMSIRKRLLNTVIKKF